jgi:predicted RND superfamily exporter protein
MIPRNELNDRWVDYFAPGIKFRTDSEFVMENLTGIYLVEYSLDSGEPSGIGKPDYLTAVESFRRWYEGQPGVIQVNAYSEIAMRLNKHMHGDDASYYRLPETRELAAQYHLLYTMSLPMGLDLNNRVNLDVSATRFTVTIANLTTVELRGLVARADEWLRTSAPPSMHAIPTSPSVMFAHVSERNLKQMVYGTGLALALITLAMIVALKSVPYGLLSIVPNLVPAAAGLGIWALWRGEIGLSLSTVTTMTLGIVVDDTVHFLNKYLRARREKQLGVEDAVRHAFATVGSAMFVTSLILVAGFLVLALSAYRLNAWMGQLASLTIIAALAADLFLLPPILLQFEELKIRNKPKPGE